MRFYSCISLQPTHWPAVISKARVCPPPSGSPFPFFSPSPPLPDGPKGTANPSSSRTLMFARSTSPGCFADVCGPGRPRPSAETAVCWRGPLVLYACLLVSLRSSQAGWFDCPVMCLAQWVVVLRDGFRSEWTEFTNGIGQLDSSE